MNLADATLTCWAKYEYDPYGGLRSSYQHSDYVGYATTFAFCFSTKYLDTETGLYYFGYRYYLPRLGRWISRDPIEELGGENLYGYVSDDPEGEADPLGLGHYGRCTASDRCCTQSQALWVGKFPTKLQCFVANLRALRPDLVNAAVEGGALMMATAAARGATLAGGRLGRIGTHATSLLAILTALKMVDAMLDVIKAYDMCNNEICIKDRPADTLCTYFSYRCTCLEPNGTEYGFTPIGTTREPPK